MANFGLRINKKMTKRLTIYQHRERYKKLSDNGLRNKMIVGGRTVARLLKDCNFRIA